MSYTVTIEKLDEQPTAVVRGTVRVEDIPEFMGGAFGDVMKALADQHLHPVGPPFARYRIDHETFDVEAGFPCDAVPEPAGRVEPSSLPGGDVATTLHVGGYDHIGEAYEAVTEWMGEHHWQVASAPWETYLDDPSVHEPRTLVRFPARLAT